MSEEKVENKTLCLICLKELAYLYPDLLERGLHSYQTSPMDDANDFLIYGGYGSRHDDELVKAFICDDCFESRKKMSIFYKVERSNNENR